MSFPLVVATVSGHSIHYCRRTLDTHFHKIEVDDYLPMLAMGLEGVQQEGSNVHSDMVRARCKIEIGEASLPLEMPKVGGKLIAAADLRNKKATHTDPGTQEEDSGDPRPSRDARGNIPGFDAAGT